MANKSKRESFADLFTKKAFAQIATLMPNGSPQVTPVWFDTEGQYIRINSAKGRQKDRNLRRDPRVAISIQDPDDPYRYVQLRGKVVEITEAGADAHIDLLSQKYTGESYNNHRADQVRVIYKILVENLE